MIIVKFLKLRKVQYVHIIVYLKECNMTVSKGDTIFFNRPDNERNKWLVDQTLLHVRCVIFLPFSGVVLTHNPWQWKVVTSLLIQLLLSFRRFMLDHNKMQDEDRRRVAWRLATCCIHMPTSPYFLFWGFL